MTHRSRNDRFGIFERTGGVSPQIGAVGLALSWLEHLHRRLVGVHHPVLQDVCFQGVHQRLELHPTTAHPRPQRRAWNGQTGTAKDGLLPVQRQVVGELCHQHLSQQPCGRDAFVDDVRRHGGLYQGLALSTRPIATHVALYTEDTRLVVQLLGHILPNASHLAATTAGGDVWLVADFDAWQVRWQRLALRLVFDARRDSFGVELGHIVMNGLRVLIQRFFQQASLLGAEALGLRSKLQPFEQRVLMREFVDGGLLEGDRLAQRLDNLTQFFCVQMVECRWQRP